MTRFNRTRLIEQLDQMAEQIKQRNSFDHNNGTAQLHPHPGRVDAATDALIDKAVAYGRWRALQDIANDLENRTLGT